MKKYLYTLLIIAGIVAMPFIASALSVSWDRYQVGAERPLFPTDKILVGASATTTQATLEVQGSFAVATSTLGCAQFGVGGLLSSTGTNCGSGGGGSSPATSTNPIMFTYAVSTSTTATSTFAGPIGNQGYIISTSTSLEVCYYPDSCQYQVPRTSTSSDVKINAALLAGSLSNTPVYIKGYGTSTPYIISNIIQLPSHVKFFGDGMDVSVIKADAGYNPATTPYGSTNSRTMIIGYNSQPIYDNVLTGMTFDANVQNNPGLNTNGNNFAVWFQSVNNFTYDHVKTVNTINWSVFFNKSIRLWIQNSIALGGYSTVYNQNDGFHIRNSSNWYVTNNYCDTAAGGGTSGDDCIVFVADSGATADMAQGVIANNIINQSGSRGIIGDIDTSFNIKDITIANNIIASTTQAGIKLYTANSRTGQYYDIVINGNVFNRIGTVGTDGGSGILLDQDFGTSRNLFNNVVIANNVIQSMVYTSGYGLYMRGGGNNVTISSNQFNNLSGVGGIDIGGSSNPVTDYMISGNIIKTFSSVSGAKGITLFGSPQGTVVGNEIYGNTTGTTYGMYIQSDGTNQSSNLNVSNNLIRNVVNGVSEINSGANPSNNQYTGNTFTTVTNNYSLIGATSGYSSLVLGTTTASNGVNIATGCYAVNGTCITGGGGGSVTGTTGQVAYLSGTNTAVGTSTVFITTAGNVGIGTTTPTTAFQVVSQTAPKIFVDGFGAPTPGIVFRRANGTIAAPTALFVNDPFLSLLAGGFGTTTFINSAQIRAFAAQQWTDTAAGSYMTFGTTPNNSISIVEAMRIDQDSSVLLGTTTHAVVPGKLVIATSTTAQLTLQGNSGETPWNVRSIGGNLYFATSSATSQATSSVSAFIIDKNGAVYAPSAQITGAAATDYWCYDANGQFIRVSAVCTVSARKYKKDIEPLPIGLDDLLKMQPVEYKKKDPMDAMDSHEQMGFIADDVAQISPAMNEMLVTYADGGTKGDVQGFRYDQVTSLIVQSIKDLNSKIEYSSGKAKRSVEENWQWMAIGLLVMWNLYLTFRKK